MREQLERQPIVEVAGVVGPRGPSGGQSRGQSDWTFWMTLELWRGPDGRMRRDCLSVRKWVDHDTLEKLMDTFSAFEVVKLRVHLAESSNGSTPEGLLLSPLGPADNDTELQDYSRKLQEPVTLDHPRFGRFTLDRRMGWFEANATWGTDSIRLSLSTESEAEAGALLQVAERVWDERKNWDRQVRMKAAAELLDLRNEVWREEGDVVIDATEFGARMRLTSIGMSDGGSFEFWFDDGDLFWGHSICVVCDENGPKRASMEG